MTDYHEAKKDKDKPRTGLMLTGFAKGLWWVACVATFGAGKYGENTWQDVPDALPRYKDALARHLLAGDTMDRESGLPHMAHVAWNALAILSLTK